ncbi:MAG: hypothetical protein MAGBODY4_01657 [Candidatus Marinimicrobia bacterium]|nr:hypothetical protein [Candidatus Neomarinimicrobiota bacterium]
MNYSGQINPCLSCVSTLNYGRKLNRLDNKVDWSRILTWLVILAGVYFGLVALIYLFQNRFIYHPESRIWRTPADVGLEYERVEFSASDGVQLSGWFIPHEEARAVMLYFHGNAGNLADRVEFLSLLHTLNISIFGIDFRGYGESEGTPTPRGTLKDAEAAWEYLVEKRDIPPDRIVIYGRSLGGTIASWLATRHEPKALILGSTFTSAADMAKEMFPFIPVDFLINIPYKTREYLQQIHCPVLISHSTQDDVVPFYHGEELFQVANEPKEFLELRGAHDDVVFTSRETYIQGMGAFLSKYAEQPKHLQNR